MPASPRRPALRSRLAALVLALPVLLSACGDGTDGDGAPKSPASATLGTSQLAPEPLPAAPTGPSAPPARDPTPPPAPPAPPPVAPRPTDLPADAAAAARFLSQATFGPTPKAITELLSVGRSAWIEAEFLKAPSSLLAQVAVRMGTLEERAASIPTIWVQHAFWQAAVTGEDALRQRVAFALSQIFVVSMVDPAVGTRMAAAWWDLLARNAFGNFRTLMEEVARSPAMGTYLSHLGNRKADPTTGRLPDENFARELMQLFTIGLYELEQDGTVRLDARREPIETYTSEDVAGLARVFTGFSWGGPDRSPARFVNRLVSDSDQTVIPMQGYPDYHEPGPKAFLGRTIEASTPDASLAAALDHLFAHPNVGPFIGRQLIQRLVTSNPSPAYVARVAAAFANDGRGVRGDMKAVIRAVLLDPEAVSPLACRCLFDGRLREPLLRTAVLLRALEATSGSGNWMIGTTDDPASLGQSALRAPSVFNFYRPSYVAPNTRLAQAGRVAPELQITHETSVAGWVNAVRSLLDTGLGTGGDVKPALARFDVLAVDPAALIDRLVVLLAPGQIPAALRERLIAEVAAVPLPADPSDAAGRSAALQNRTRLAVLLIGASPEFVVQL